jgi:fatty acid desaturase
MCRPSTRLGLRDVFGDYVACGVALGLGILVDRFVFWLAVALYIGVRQRYLKNLTHECVHHKLVASRRGNVFIGRGILWSLAMSYVDYNVEHLQHHAYLGEVIDPKLVSYRAKGAASPSRDKTHFLLRVVCAPLLGEVQFVALKGLWGPREERPWDRCGRALLWLGAALCAIELHLLPVFLSWTTGVIIVRPAVNWLTDLGNHAGLIEQTDPILQTRGWTSHWLTNHLLGGHLDDMYHPIHHCFPRVVWRRLPEAEQEIRMLYPDFARSVWCSGFFFRRRATPTTPSVIDDIVFRLRAA